MPHPSKRKGNTFEREIVNFFRDMGVEAKRAYASDGRSLGMGEEVDVMVYGPFSTLPVSAKRRKKLASYIKPTGQATHVILREDRGEMLILMRLDDYLADLDSAYLAGQLDTKDHAYKQQNV